MKQFGGLFIKSLLILAVTLLGYYIFYIVPKQNEKETLTRIYLNTLQNRIAYTELIKLDALDPNLQEKTSSLIRQIKETNKEGLAQLADVKSNNKTLINLFEEHKNIYKEQSEILEKLSSMKTFEEGIIYLKSDKSTSLLTRETNLLLKYKVIIDQ